MKGINAQFLSFLSPHLRAFVAGFRIALGFRWKWKVQSSALPDVTVIPLYAHIRTCCIVPDTTFSCPCRHRRCFMLSLLLLLFPLLLFTSPHLSLPLLTIRGLGSAIYKRIPTAKTPVSQSFYSFGVSPWLNTIENHTLLCKKRRTRQTDA